MMDWVWTKGGLLAHLSSKPILELALEKVQKVLICFEYPLAKIDSEERKVEDSCFFEKHHCIFYNKPLFI